MATDLLSRVSGSINETMDRRAMSALDLVEAAGVEARQVGYALAGSPMLSIDDLIRIAAVLDLAVTWVLSGAAAELPDPIETVDTRVVSSTRADLAATLTWWRNLSGFATTKMANIAKRKIGAFQIADGSKPGNVGANIVASYLWLLGLDLVLMPSSAAQQARLDERKRRTDPRSMESYLRGMAIHLEDAPTWHQLSEDDPDVAGTCAALRAVFETGNMSLKRFSRESDYNWKTLARSDGRISFAGQIDRACVTASFIGMGLALVDRDVEQEKAFAPREIVINDETRAVGVENTDLIVRTAAEIARKRDLTPITARSSLEAISKAARAAGLRLVAVEREDVGPLMASASATISALATLDRPPPSTDVDRTGSDRWLARLPARMRIQNVELHPRASEILFSQVADVCAREGRVVAAIDRRSGKTIASIGSWDIDAHKAFVGTLIDMRRAGGLTVEEAIARCRQADPEKNLTGPLTPFSYVFTYADAIGCDLKAALQ